MVVNGQQIMQLVINVQNQLPFIAIETQSTCKLDINLYK